METEGRRPLGESGSERPYGYEPPRVEQVMTPADFEREALFAGAPIPSAPPA